MGELDPSFGDNQALVALTRDGVPLSGGPELVLPGDTSTGRFVDSVAQIDVAVHNPASSAVGAGAIDVEHDSQTTTLTAAQLAALASFTLPVSFLAGSPTPTMDTEMGPTLSEVLAAAGIQPDQDTYVSAVGSDGYVATVTPAEATFGNRPLLIATKETATSTGLPTTNTPRLVTDGDLKGGRYDSNVTDLVVGELTVTGRFISGSASPINGNPAGVVKRTVVVVGQTTVSLPGGRSRTVRITLNSTGRGLLASLHHFLARLTATQHGGRISSQTVNFRVPVRHARKKHSPGSVCACSGPGPPIQPVPVPPLGL